MHVMDVAPTLLDIAGVDHPSTLRRAGSRALAGQVVEGRCSPAKPNHHVVRTIGSAGSFGAIERFARATGSCCGYAQPMGIADWELYNLRKDPGETQDLAGEYPEKKKRVACFVGRIREDEQRHHARSTLV